MRAYDNKKIKSLLYNAIKHFAEIKKESVKELGIEKTFINYLIDDGEIKLKKMYYPAKTFRVHQQITSTDARTSKQLIINITISADVKEGLDNDEWQ